MVNDFHRNLRLFLFLQAITFFLLINMIPQVNAFGEPPKQNPNFFFELIVFIIFILLFFIGTLYIIYWGAKRSSSSYRQQIIDSIPVPIDKKITVLNSPLFLFYYVITVPFYAFISFFTIIFFLDDFNLGFKMIMAHIPLFSLSIIVLITSALFIYHPLRKVDTLRDDATDGKEPFSYVRFFVVIGIFFALFLGLSWWLNPIFSSSNPNDGKCDICGDFAIFEYTINNMRIHEYCFPHGIAFAVFNPDVLLKDPKNRQFPILYDLYFCGYVIGCAIVAGKGYRWSISL